MKRLICVLLFVSLFLPLAIPAMAADNKSQVMRIGIYYGTNALPAANLANEIGSGYRFGWFDKDRSFTQVGFTSVEKISMLKDKVMYLSGGSYTESKGNTRVGAYHIDSGNAFSSFEEAFAYSESFKAQGIPAFPAYISGEYRVRVEHYSTAEYAAADLGKFGISGGFVVGNSSTCVTVVNTNTAEILFEFDCGNERYLGVMPCAVDERKPQTWFKGYKYYGGFEYKRLNGNDITVVNYVDIEDYVKGVVPYEMSPSWPTEALKAQAICARTFALSHLNKHSSSGFDLCNSVDCQVYQGTNRAMANSDSAVDQCAGVYATYGGKYIQAVYHSSNGGSTESAVNVWGSNIAYLLAVPDNFEDLQKAQYGIWRVELTNDQITRILKEKNYPVIAIKDAYVEQYTPAGNVLKLTFVDSNNTKYSFERERARTILNNSSVGIAIRSQRFYFGNDYSMNLYAMNATSTLQVTEMPVYAIGAGGITSVVSNDVYVMSASGTTQLASSKPSGDGVYRINGRGWGHNVGMSQWGARGMSELGYSAEDIIKYYYTGVSLEYLG